MHTLYDGYPSVGSEEVRGEYLFIFNSKVMSILFENVTSTPFDKLWENGEYDYLFPFVVNLPNHR